MVFLLSTNALWDTLDALDQQRTGANDMTTSEYFNHARSLAPFSASDCLALAREAAELDREAAERKSVPYVEVDREDGIRMSRSIRVY